jgi:S-adenosyl-L-methionine hydrolase (adenosine-forming)
MRLLQAIAFAMTLSNLVQIRENILMELVVTLLTDFGLQDSYASEVKGQLLSSGKRSQLIDISHEVPPFDIRWGAFQLFRSHAYFPKGTYHLAIVDPGVGSARKAIYVRTKRYHFVGPDNGILLWAVQECEKVEKAKAKIWEIPIPDDVLPTFHGRDVFAPFVTKLWKGKSLKLKPVKNMEGKSFPLTKVSGGHVEGEIIGHDRFGNIITSVPHQGSKNAEAQLTAWREKILSVESYSSIRDGRAGMVRGSHGFWEIACHRQSAWRLLNVELGDRVTVSSK